jgi:hypothetical protein
MGVGTLVDTPEGEMMITRRKFTKAVSAAAALLALDSRGQVGIPQGGVGVAPVGLCSIAEVFMRAANKSPHLLLAGLVTGHPEQKGKKFAAQYAVPETSIIVRNGR